MNFERSYIERAKSLIDEEKKLMFKRIDDISDIQRRNKNVLSDSENNTLDEIQKFFVIEACKLEKAYNKLCVLK